MIAAAIYLREGYYFKPQNPPLAPGSGILCQRRGGPCVGPARNESCVAEPSHRSLALVPPRTTHSPDRNPRVLPNLLPLNH